jgi:nucleoside-diphosphate-sugar epimerase
VRILVTGATGFLGSHVAEHLASEDHAVRALVRRTSDLSYLSSFPHEEAVGDVTDAASLEEAVDGVDAVIHTAGLVKARRPADFDAVNAHGTRNLLAAIDAAAPNIRRLVHISSLAAHGPSQNGRPRPIEAPPEPITAYGRSKLKGEELVRSWHLCDRSVIIRPPVVYGPRDPELLPFFQAVRWRIAPLLDGGHNRASLIYVDDASRAIAQAAVAEAGVAGKAYSIADGEIYTWRDMLTVIQEAVGNRALVISTPPWAYGIAAIASETWGLLRGRAVSLTRDKLREMSQAAWVCSHHEISRDLGWTPMVNAREGAKLTANWYRQQGWL